MKKEIFQKEYDRLNDEQKQAVDTIYGPVMVVAGPGTWKTQIIALRAANILIQTDLSPENILITTFTEAWVIAIKKRLESFLWLTWLKINVSTFHSFASDVISEFPHKFIDERALKVIDDIESFEILSSILDQYIESWDIKKLFNVSDKNYYLRAIKANIWNLKRESISPSKFTQIIDDQRAKYDTALEGLKTNKRIRDLEKRTRLDSEKYDIHIWKLTELNLIYEKYNEILKSESYYDFADMINFVVAKFETDDDILAHYSEKYQFMMIDEFQDTNNAQNNIINIILNLNLDEQNILVVWDDDQSIYRFQWANIENMLDFITKYPSTKIVVLKDNYRSSQSILDLSHNLIEHNDERMAKRINVSKDIIARWWYRDRDENKFYILNNDIQEKVFVYNAIWALGDDKNTFAIILKTNSQVLEWSNFLRDKWLNVISRANNNILNNHFVLLLLDILAIIDDPYHSDEKFIDILRSNLVDIENIDIISINRQLYNLNYTRKYKLWLWDVLSKINDYEYLVKDLKNKEKIDIFVDMFLKLQSSLVDEGIRWFVWSLLEYLNIYEYIETRWDFWDLQDIFTFVEKIVSYIDNNPSIKLTQILNKFRLYQDFNISINRKQVNQATSNIEILTAHSSKWLEFDYVFIPQLYEKNWHWKTSRDILKLPRWVAWQSLQFAWLDDKEYDKKEKNILEEEERRLFFVALTRAKRWLFLTMSSIFEDKLKIQSNYISELWINFEPKDIELTIDDEKYLISNILKPSILIDKNKDELSYIENFLQNYKLSPTDLNKFIDEPLDFLRSVIFRYPFVSNENLIFWSAYHRVLELIYIEKSKWNTTPLEWVIELFKQELKNYALSPMEHERLLERWLSGLEWYYPIFLNNNRKILELEYNLRSQNIYYDDIPLTWKIDKIELISDASTNWSDFVWQWALFSQEIALIDYKTGSIKGEWYIKWIDRYWNKKDLLSPWEWNYFRQLLFYKLMIEGSRDFQNSYKIWELALDFIGWKNWEYRYVPVSYTSEDFEFFKQELKDAWFQISSLEFWGWFLDENL